MADPRGKEVLEPLVRQIEAEARKVFGGQGRYGDTKGQPDALGIGDIMQMMNDMPLVSVLMFLQRSFPTHPEDIVAELLAQVDRLE